LALNFNKKCDISRAYFFKKTVVLFPKMSDIITMEKIKHKSPTAKALADRKYHQRIVVAKKGRGSYNRKRLEKKHA
jgi:stalled ribosome alternative rescue factor ArfA